MSKMANVNSNLAYELLLFLNCFYLGMFFVCEVAMGILKAINVSYQEKALLLESEIFTALSLVEIIRIFIRGQGNLDSKKVPVFFSVILTIPCAVGVCYFMFYQTCILKLEYILCAMMLIFHALELFILAILFIFIVCKNQQYE